MPCDLDLSGYMQFGCFQGHQVIQGTEDHNGYNNGKICNQGTPLRDEVGMKGAKKVNIKNYSKYDRQEKEWVVWFSQ